MKRQRKREVDPTTKLFVEHWRRVGPELERIRRWELRNFDYKKNLPAIDALLQIACERAVPRTTSGLVELQRLLAKARR
jgi:hypothetical protein